MSIKQTLQAIQSLPNAAVDCVRGGIDLPAAIESAAAQESHYATMLATLENLRAYLAKHADKLPPMSLSSLECIIAKASKAKDF